jgi:hypothetical protein
MVRRALSLLFYAFAVLLLGVEGVAAFVQMDMPGEKPGLVALLLAAGLVPLGIGAALGTEARLRETGLALLAAAAAAAVAAGLTAFAMAMPDTARLFPADAAALLGDRLFGFVNLAALAGAGVALLLHARKRSRLSGRY